MYTFGHTYIHGPNTHNRKLPSLLPVNNTHTHICIYIYTSTGVYSMFTINVSETIFLSLYSKKVANLGHKMKRMAYKRNNIGKNLCMTLQ